MVGHEDMFMIDHKADINEELMNFISEHEYTFILVYEGDKNNIVAYIKTR